MSTARLTISAAFLASSLLLLGCGSGDAGMSGKAGTAGTSEDHDDGHDHEAPGPHGGHLIVLGEEQYHAELTHDEATHTVTVYLLDASVEMPVTNGPDELTLQLFEDGQFVDHALKQGTGGAYSLTDEPLCDRLLHDEQVKGRLRVTIAGEEYVGVIDHMAHEHGDHAGHDHGAESGTADADEEHDHGPGEAGHDH